jgi:hypothetical protein
MWWCGRSIERKTRRGLFTALSWSIDRLIDLWQADTVKAAQRT